MRVTGRNSRPEVYAQGQVGICRAVTCPGIACRRATNSLPGRAFLCILRSHESVQTRLRSFSIVSIVPFDMSGFFYNLGRHVGRAAVPTIRKSKWIWDGLTGTEEDALRAEAAFGATLAAELRASTERFDDPAAASLLNGLCARLAGCVRDKRRVFHCEALRDDTPNAMALPGGYVFVSHSLLDLCERRPEEMAFIIGHEMAHIIREHAWSRMLNQMASRAVSAIAARTGPLGGWLHGKGMPLLQSAHSRDNEQDADELGLRLMAAAGFAPDAAIACLQRIQRLDPNRTELGPYLASHPPAADRIARLAPLCRPLASAQPR